MVLPGGSYGFSAPRLERWLRERECLRGVVLMLLGRQKGAQLVEKLLGKVPELIHELFPLRIADASPDHVDLALHGGAYAEVIPRSPAVAGSRYRQAFATASRIRARNSK